MCATIAARNRTAKAILFLLLGLAANLGGSLSWAAAPGSPWGANYFPNVALVTQDGAKVRFYDDLLKDKVVAINFIYTHCTDSCSAETAALRKVQKALGDRMGRDVFFYTISIDAKRDKPQVLKAYAEKFHAGPGWLFLSGRKEDVTLIRQRLGMYRDDNNAESKLNEHNINILMGSEAGGQWIKRSPFEETQALVRILGTRLQSGRTAATSPAVQSAPATQTAAIPAVSPVPLNPLSESPGEKLFYSGCSNCHRMETAEADDIGPSLAGITQKRDRAWLKRWLKAPDAMIKAKDPTALAIFKQYGEIYMPNLKLSDGDIESLLQFMDKPNP